MRNPPSHWTAIDLICAANFRDLKFKTDSKGDWLARVERAYSPTLVEVLQNVMRRFPAEKPVDAARKFLALWRVENSKPWAVESSGVPLG